MNTNMIYCMLFYKDFSHIKNKKEIKKFFTSVQHLSTGRCHTGGILIIYYHWNIHHDSPPLYVY